MLKLIIKCCDKNSTHNINNINIQYQVLFLNIL